MDNRVLVTYTSRYGSTAEIAQRVGEVLSKQGFVVDVLPVLDVSSVFDYDGVVLGGAIYSGEWSAELCDFAQTHEAVLRSAHVALFVAAIRLRDDSEEMRQSVVSSIDMCRVMLNPVSIGLFAGKVDYAVLSPIVRLQVQTKDLPEGDFRDWNAIESWAGEVATRFHEPISSPDEALLESQRKRAAQVSLPTETCCGS